jgi:recombination protein RecT
MSNSNTTNQVQSLLSSDGVKNRLNEILGKKASTFATSVMQIIKSNALLANAEPNSVVGAAMTAATLDLPLNNNIGFAYIIPFNTKNPDGSKTVKAQFQIGYKGFIQLAQRSGQFKTINVSEVKEGEISSRDRLSGEIDFNWIQDDGERLKRKTIGYLGYFRLLNGFEKTMFMSIDELNAHGKKFSKTFTNQYGLWKTDFDSMAQKTVIKLLLSKYAPLSIDMATAVQTDQASFNNAQDPDDIAYLDNEEVKIDPDQERARMLVDSIKDLDDVDFARSNISEDEKVLHADIDLKEQMIKKVKK